MGYTGIVYHTMVYYSIALYTIVWHRTIPYHTVLAGPDARSFAGPVAMRNANAQPFARLDARSFADTANDLLARSFANI